MKKSKTQKALDWMAAGKGRTMYAAAKKFELDPSVLSRAVKARKGRVTCPTCGTLVPRQRIKA